MNFKIVTNGLPEKIYNGLLIEYSVSPLFGIKRKWISEIKDVDEPNYFADDQIKGPYSFWLHEHFFEETDEGTIVRDEIEYAVPFSIFGSIAHSLLIKRQLKKIFDYRTKTITEIFRQSQNFFRS